MTRAAVLATAAALALLLAPRSLLAQDCPQTTLGDIEDEVMCPICGTPLGLASEAPQAQQQRAFIEDQIADCRSKEEIKTALVAQFGEGVLALPGDESGDDELERRARVRGPGAGDPARARRDRVRRRRVARRRREGRRAARAPPRRPAPTRPGSTPTWSATTCDHTARRP